MVQSWINFDLWLNFLPSILPFIKIVICRCKFLLLFTLSHMQLKYCLTLSKLITNEDFIPFLLNLCNAFHPILKIIRLVINLFFHYEKRVFCNWSCNSQYIQCNSLQFNWKNLFSTTYLQFHYNYNHNVMIMLLIFIHPLKFDTWHNSKLPNGVLIEFSNMIYIQITRHIAIGKYVDK